MRGIVKMKKRVFLGGTYNNSTWRDEIIRYFNDLNVNYFNPVVDDWNEEAQKNELRERETCDFCLYTITPKMTGVYSIAEVVDDSNKRPKKTIFVILEKDEDKSFSNQEMRSLQAVAGLVKRNGAKVFYDLKSAAKTIAIL